MRIHIDIAVPYSLREIFDKQVRLRANALRAEAMEIYQDRKSAGQFICSPQRHLGGKIPLDLSVQSAESHQQVMNYLGQIKYGVYS